MSRGRFFWLISGLTLASSMALSSACSSAADEFSRSGPSQPSAGNSNVSGAANVAGAFNVAGAAPSAGASSGGSPAAGGSTAHAGSAGMSSAGAGSGGSNKNPAPSAACGKGVAPPADGYHDIQANNKARRFVVHLPPSYDGKHPFPAITTFHSKGDDATQWDSVKFYYQDAAGAGNVLVYMEALPDGTLGGARSFERDPADDLLYVDGVVSWLRQNVCFDSSRLFALGHSNGATFVQNLACHRGHLFRAVAGHAGDDADTTGCDGPIASWLSVGEGDNASLVATSKARVEFWKQTNGCSSLSAPTEPDPCVLFAACSPGKPVEFCDDTLGDHKWAAWMSGATSTFFASL